MKTPLALLAAATLVACGDSDPERRQGPAGAVAEDDRIECAVEGAAEFEKVCTVQRVPGDEGLTLTIRSPSGGFRRLLVTDDGRGVIAADGADPARVTVLGDKGIEVNLAGDRYRLPAMVKAAPKQAQ